MKDFKNMNAVSKQIKTDKAISLAVSILGALVGAFCVVFTITILFN
mgnify:CR=1 FL=1